jgi:hypothetical protein
LNPAVAPQQRILPFNHTHFCVAGNVSPPVKFTAWYRLVFSILQHAAIPVCGRQDGLHDPFSFNID